MKETEKDRWQCGASVSREDISGVKGPGILRQLAREGQATQNNTFYIDVCYQMQKYVHWKTSGRGRIILATARSFSWASP